MSARAAPTLALARRSIVGTLRQPEAIFPSLFFPLFFASLSVAGFSRATNLPGFPAVDSFVDFMMATTVCQGVLFGCTQGGSDMALDIQDGFFDRLAVSPVPRPLLLVGRLAGTMVWSAAQSIVFMAIFIAFGAEVKAGLAGMVVIVIVATLLSLGVGGLSVALALRTGSQEAVQAFFPVFFITLFLSSAFFPRQLMNGWFKTAAGINPLSHMIEGLRHLVISGFDWSTAGKALLVVSALAVIALVASSLALRRRLAAR